MVLHDISRYFGLVYFGDLDRVLDALLADYGHKDGATAFVFVLLAKFLVTLLHILFAASPLKM